MDRQLEYSGKGERGRAGRTGRAERAVGLEEDAALVAPRLELVLRVERVELDLVDGRDDRPRLLELLEVRDAPVRDANRLDLARLEQRLHARPRLAHVPVAVDGARAVRVDGEERRRLVRDEPHGPVDEVQVEVVDAERGERLVEALLDLVVVRVPPAGGVCMHQQLHGGAQPGRRGGRRTERRERTHSFEVRNSSERGTPDALMPAPTSCSFW